MKLKPYLRSQRWKLLMAVLMLVGVMSGFIDPAFAMASSMLLTTSGQLGNGTIVQVSVGSPTALVNVGNCRDVQFDTGSSAKVDMTNLNSVWKEFLLGLPDPGSLIFSVDTDFGDVGQAALRSARVTRTKCDFKVILPGGTTPNASMQGYVIKFPVQTAVDSAVRTQVECIITGPITLA